MLRRLLLALCAAAALLGAAALGGLWYIGAWNLVFPNHTHETQPPHLPATLARPALLVFTKTNGFRHTEAIPAGLALFEEVAARRGWGLFPTENGAVFSPELLARFDAVIFLNTTGDVLDEAQEAAFRAFLEGGGGWVGIHAAGDGSHAGWRWYVETLIGADYVGHPMDPQFQRARVRVEDRSHPATRRLPEWFAFLDEWYSWERSPRGDGRHVLATLDESSYEPVARLFGSQRDLRMGDDHPVMWWRCVGRGRAFYSALGHRAEAYRAPLHAGVLEGAAAWAAGAEGSGCAER